MKAVKTPSLFVILFVSLAICACENPFISRVLDSKTITFDSNGGSPVPSQTIYKNEKISEPQDPVLADLLFGGWWWYTDYGFPSKWDFDDIPKGDMTLYAEWYDDYEIKNPTARDFFMESNWSDGLLLKGVWNIQYNGYPKVVTVTPKPGKSEGIITVYYQRTDTTYYSGKITTPPSDPGAYRVTFDVSEFEARKNRLWNAAYELEAGTLVIKVPPVSSAGKLKGYLNSFNTNTRDEPYTIPLNISDLEGIASALNSAPDIYVTLDLSGSKLITIEENAFYTEATTPSTICKTLTGIILPNNDLSIGKSAFRECTNLTNVNIPDKVYFIDIGDHAFYGCYRLNSISIPGASIIGNYAFAGCSNLTSVTFKGTVDMASNAFGDSTETAGGYIGDLCEAYSREGPGTYTRSYNGYIWTKSY